MKIHCDYCNNIFDRFPCEIQSFNFCSKKCYYDFIKPNQNCAVCFKIRSINEMKKSKDFCHKCHYKHKKESIPNYSSDIRRKSFLYSRKRRGIPIDKPITKRKNGEGYISKTGYMIYFKPDHPNSSKCGKIMGHTLIMSEHLGRPLKKGETVHHKNGIRHDNRIENLELWHSNHGRGQRVEDKIKYCKEFLEEYGYQIIKLDVPQT